MEAMVVDQKIKIVWVVVWHEKTPKPYKKGFGDVSINVKPKNPINSCLFLRLLH